MRQNLHTHSTFCDGKDTIEEMVNTAIEKKFDILGFSGHGHLGIDSSSMQDTQGYIDEVLKMKQKYKDSISIYLGIEQDMLERIQDKAVFDYVIGSKHFLGTIPIDYSKEVFEQLLQSYQNDIYAMCKDYYEDLSNMANWNEVDIIGHIDLISKYNEDQSYFQFDDPKYFNSACDCIDRLLEKNKIFEVNTGAIARGYRKSPYPYKNLLTYLYEKKARILLNSDCHNRHDLDCAFTESLELIKKCGFKEMQIMTKEGFKDLEIGYFK